MKAILQTSLLAGTIIGAGVFSLPFVFQDVGLTVGIIALAVGSFASVSVYLLYADVIARTDGEHRFVGYTERYLGKGAAWFSVAMTIAEMIFVMTIYLILSVSFSNLVTHVGADMEKLLLFWFFGSVALFMTLKRVAWIEFFITSGIVAIIGVIFALGAPHIQPSIIKKITFSPALLAPLAPILFALSGRVAIPTLMQYSKRNVRNAITFGVITPAVVYIFFIAGVIALSPVVSEDAVTGLIGAVPVWVLVLVGALGLLSLISSYITVGIDVRRSLALDLRMPFWLQFLIIVGGPVGLYYAGFTSFIGLVSFVGGVFLALEAFFIMAMWLRAKKKAPRPPMLMHKMPVSALVLIALIFGAVLVYEIIQVIL